VTATTPPKDLSQLRSRRREARRRRNIARADVAFGLLAAIIVLLLLAPGLAIVAIAALLVLVACVVSIVVERWRSRQRATRAPQRQ